MKGMETVLFSLNRKTGSVKFVALPFASDQIKIDKESKGFFSRKTWYSVYLNNCANSASSANVSPDKKSESPKNNPCFLPILTAADGVISDPGNNSKTESAFKDNRTSDFNISDSIKQNIAEEIVSVFVGQGPLFFVNALSCFFNDLDQKQRCTDRILSSSLWRALYPPGAYAFASDSNCAKDWNWGKTLNVINVPHKIRSNDDSKYFCSLFGDCYSACRTLFYRIEWWAQEKQNNAKKADFQIDLKGDWRYYKPVPGYESYFVIYP